MAQYFTLLLIDPFQLAGEAHKPQDNPNLMPVFSSYYTNQGLGQLQPGPIQTHSSNR
jgi:hypothetical protein